MDFSGKRVAVIGTGSSGVQSIPIIAKQAQHLTVFQRTPCFTIPAYNGPTDKESIEKVKKNYSSFRERVRNTPTGVSVIPTDSPSGHSLSAEGKEEVLKKCWDLGGLRMLGAFNDIMLDKSINDIACEYSRNKIKSIVKDPEVAKLLSPTDYPIGSKRICLDTGYYETFNLPNVSLVSVRDTPIEEITPTGLKVGGKEYEFDVIVFATGFDAMTGSLTEIDIRGLGGLTLKKKWEAGPRTYIGVMSAQFPNLFIVTGPGSPSVMSNMIVSIEQNVEWITNCIGYLSSHSHKRIEAIKEVYCLVSSSSNFD